MPSQLYTQNKNDRLNHALHNLKPTKTLLSNNTLKEHKVRKSQNFKTKSRKRGQAKPETNIEQQHRISFQMPTQTSEKTCNQT